MTPLTISGLLPFALIGNFFNFDFALQSEYKGNTHIRAVPLTISQISCGFNNPEDPVCAGIHQVNQILTRCFAASY